MKESVFLGNLEEKTCWWHIKRQKDSITSCKINETFNKNMSRSIVKTRLFNLRLYKFDVPGESDVGVILKTFGTGGGHEVQQFKLSWYIGQGRDSKAGLSKSFVNFVKDFLIGHVDSNVTNQIFDYILLFLFQGSWDRTPGCPVLVFHFHCVYADNVPEVSIYHSHVVFWACWERKSQFLVLKMQ